MQSALQNGAQRSSTGKRPPFILEGLAHVLRVGWVLLGQFWFGSPSPPPARGGVIKEVKHLQSNKEEEEFICGFTELRPKRVYVLIDETELLHSTESTKLVVILFQKIWPKF